MAKNILITEKPSVAMEFAKVLNINTSRKDGYLEADNWIITWCVGHLVTMSYPEKYDEKLKFWRLDTLPFIPENCIHNAHMFYVVCRSLQERTELIAYLKKNGIIAAFHYIPLHSSPAGLKFGRFDGKDEITIEYSERLVRLPLYYGLSDKEQDFVIETVNNFFFSR